MGKKQFKPKVTGNTLLYRFCRAWFYPFAWLFYRRRTYNGKENLLPGKPLFLIPNHQNAFMDATSFIPVKYFWQFSFLMRAGSFNNRLASKFLYALNMLPIYRQMDGADLNESNSEVFENCAWLMERKRPIICWAEGTHSLIRRIRPIKKGPLRFGFAAEERNNWTLDVHFVPVGLNYSDRENFGGDYLANIGKPIRLADYRELYEQNPARAITEVKKAIEQQLEKLAIHIPSQEYYNETEWLREMAINDYRVQNNFTTNQVQEFEKGSWAIQQAEKLFAPGTKATVVKEHLHTYWTNINKQNLRDHLFAPGHKTLPVFPMVLFFVLLSPLFLVGYAINIIPAWLTLALARKVVRDPAFNSSILWAAGSVLYTFFYIFIFVLAGLISGYWLYALALWPAGILTGAVALWYKRKWNKYSALQKWSRFLKTPQGKTTMELRQQIMNEFYAA